VKEQGNGRGKKEESQPNRNRVKEEARLKEDSY
jgi:hypothetical protein